jgi:hypothetical protein
VHGIGGGQYDQVLDKLIARHLGIEPPRFSVTTATLYFPQAVNQPRACLPCVVHEGHHLKHNLLGESKQQWVQAIAAEPRGSRERQTLFFEMRDRLESAAASNPTLSDWAKRLEEMQRQAQQERVLFDRELFYAIQPEDRLSEMVEKYRTAFEG